MAHQLTFRLIQHVEPAQVQRDHFQPGKPPHNVGDALRSSIQRRVRSLMRQSAGVYGQGHVFAQLFVHGKPLGIVGVETVDHRVHLDPLDLVCPQVPNFAGLVREVGMYRAKGDQVFVRNGDQPVVGTSHLIGARRHPQHNRLVHPGRLHVRLDAAHRVDRDGLETQLRLHVLRHRVSDPVRPYVGVNVNAHG